MAEDDQENLKHFNYLTSLMNQMINYSNFEEIPEELIETFGQTLLSTQELNVQINKLVLKHFR